MAAGQSFWLKEAWEEMHGDRRYGQAQWIAERVFVQGRPRKHPSDEAVRQLLKKMTDDEGRAGGGALLLLPSEHTFCML